MKTHLNLATTNLAESVRFYSTLLNAQPAKVLSDYALFITDQPGLELALDLSEKVSPTRDIHFGIFVESAPMMSSTPSRVLSRPAWWRP